MPDEITLTFAVLEFWPRLEFTRHRKPSPWRVGYMETCKELKNELRLIGAKSATLRLACAPGMIKRDGTPYASMRPDHPGVVVEYTRKGKTHRIACDQYGDWQSNLRAIVTTLNALRGIERWGTLTQDDIQGGMLALPPPPPAPQAARVLPDAEIWLAACRIARAANSPHREYDAERMLAEAAYFKDIHRAAMKCVHPDAGGTDEKAILQLNADAGLLKRHHGLP